MDYIKAISFTGAQSGGFADDKSKESLLLMKKKTACNTVILVISAFQETAFSEYVNYTHNFMPSDEEIIEMIQYAKEIGLRVILKPFVNCMDGTWRAHINFFDHDVDCEPKWPNWFKSYTEYQLHYAKLAEKVGCEMIIIGTEMIQTERRENDWRELIRVLREEYKGLICYSTDKYQEDYLTWWDCVDVMSSSGYYPIDTWDEQLDRVEKVVKKNRKPFFFSEVGCMSSKGSSLEPNRWSLQGAIDLEEQANYYEVMIKKCGERDFIEGLGIWEWSYHTYQENEGLKNKGYPIYGKPACEILYKAWSK